MVYTYKEIYEVFKRVGTKAGTARELKLPRTSVRRAIEEYEKYCYANNRDIPGYEDVPDKILLNDAPSEALIKAALTYPAYENEAKEFFDKAVEEYLNEAEEGDSFTGIAYEDESEEEIFNRYNLNPKQWQIVSISHNEWTTPFKNDDGKIIPFVNKQKKVLFKKIVSDITLDIIKEQYKLMGDKNTYAPVVRNTDSKKKPVMYEIALFDMHLGKLCYAAETGEPYDLKIAEKLFMDAVYDLLEKASHLNIEKILFPVGQDFLQYDGAVPETTSGTRQDTDSRWTKLYTTASRILVQTIDLLRKCADVDVIVVQSNHDRTVGFYIGEYLSAWYRNDMHVNVNNSPTPRKYYRYGKTLIGFSHGDQEKHDNLPLLMAREAQEEWAKVDFMQWHIGHLHKKRVTKYTDGDTFNGVEVKVLPSLTASDFWHTQKGYVKGNRMATGMVFDKEEGCVAEFLSKYIKDKK